MPGEIFTRAKAEIQNPAIPRRLIAELIDKEIWSAMEADVKGDTYEGLLARSAEESPKGAGQYFTPRELIKGIVDVMQAKSRHLLDEGQEPRRRREPARAG